MFLKGSKADHLQNHQGHLWAWRQLDSTPDSRSLFQNLRLKGMYFKNQIPLCTFKFVNWSGALIFTKKKCFITFHKHSNKNTSFHDILLSFLPGNAVRISYVGRCWQSPETMKSTTNSIQKGAIGFQDWRENVEETFAGENPEWWMDCSGLREREVTQQIYTAYYCILYWKAAG